MNIKPAIEIKESVQEEDQEKQEYKLIGSFNRTKGLILYQYNPKTDLLEEVKIEFSKTAYTKMVNGRLEISDKSIEETNVDSKCIHFEALNMNSAKNRVDKWRKGKIRDLSNLKKPVNNSIKFY